MFDLIILGGGPGGYEAAKLAGTRGLKTILIEEDSLGGTCLNRGCIPLKSFLHVSRIKQEYDQAVKGGLIQGGNCAVIQERLAAEKNAVVDALRCGVAGMEKSAGVNVVSGTGIIKEVSDNHCVITVGDDEYEAQSLIIATGSEENRLSLETNNLPYKVIYSDDFLEMKSIPEHMTIIGGGVIGIECASYLKDTGAEVTIIETSDHIGGGLDADMADAFQRILKRQGIDVITGVKVTGFDNDGVKIENKTISTDGVLVSVGRHARVDGFGLENSRIIYNKHINIDSHCQTNVKGTYACGDVTGQMMLAHVAYAQARVIVNNIMGIDDEINDYSKVPRIIYSNPEVLTIGVTEEECKSKHLDYVTKSLPMTYCGKYFAEHGKDGAVAKIIVSDNRLVGFSMIGNGSSEIGLAAELILGMKLDDIEKIIYPHPTVGEIIHELCGLN